MSVVLAAKDWERVSKVADRSVDQNAGSEQVLPLGNVLIAEQSATFPSPPPSSHCDGISPQLRFDAGGVDGRKPPARSASSKTVGRANDLGSSAKRSFEDRRSPAKELGNEIELAPHLYDGLPVRRVFPTTDWKSVVLAAPAQPRDPSVRFHLIA